MVTSSGATSSDPPFVGRQHELDLLRALLVESVSGPLRAVAVEGEAGIGKSRLLRQVNAYAQAWGFRLLTGMTEELERHRAFGVFFEMARSQLTTSPDAGIFTDLRTLGTALAEAGHPVKARLQFQAAVDIFVKLGINHEEGRISAAMRVHGIRRGRRRSPKYTTGWDSLTATELTVIGLVAQGLSNPEVAARLFLSRYTVETHLKHVFTKLAITSRVALVNEVMRHSAAPPADAGGG